MSMSFTNRLYAETKDSHTQVDRHPFVSMIRTNKLAGEMYVNFNKICIQEIPLFKWKFCGNRSF